MRHFSVKEDLIFGFEEPRREHCNLYGICNSNNKSGVCMQMYRCTHPVPGRTHVCTVDRPHNLESQVESLKKYL